MHAFPRNCIRHIVDSACGFCIKIKPEHSGQVAGGGAVSDRKYRQRGYQDRGEKKEGDRQAGGGAGPSAKKDHSFGPRAMQMPARREVSRCAQCGTLLQSADVSGKCAKCGFDLHSCKQCTYFDPSSRFECSQPIPVRIPKKDVANNCALYAMSIRVEKETSTPVQARPMDARQAFENLFKK
jgi:hypothetical protein